ncbi:major facilitator superfamily transporter [Aaosphaeria arxii CBS 175.79]|uniref:Major facilitator superfamily transporter n=1 Tax=Aaosphaeria arxii CBS 175.79 TaxID=1450172 RepID=A0A6A5Y478_9PLEO|nr:major facilitator superfamily transporter [Aaosphaeria arxii CBS 175.79]KAF2019827.1 major facilitator superfamily transporter [Aaosphaeria arxii CBS 175.79]
MATPFTTKTDLEQTTSATPSSIHVAQNLRLDPYGIPLSPTPASDQKDPLNWSAGRKYVLFAVACYSTFLCTYLTTSPVATFPQLEEQFGGSYSQVSWTLAVPSLGLAIGPLLFSSFADIYGRRPVLIASSVLTMIVTGCTTIKNISYPGYMVFRFLQGLTAGPRVVVSAVIIRDIFFEHQRGFAVGVWVMSMDLGGVIAGVISGFTALANQYWAGYHVVIAFAIPLCYEMFFMRETLYPRQLILDREQAQQDISDIKRTTDIRFWHITKIPGVNHPPAYQNIIHFFKLLEHPRLLCAILPFVFLLYWWIMSLLTMVPAAYATYSVQAQGLMFLGLAIGLIGAELLISGRLSDVIVSRLALRNNGVRTPEMRLYLGYPAIVLGAVGLVVWGCAIDYAWHWVVGQVGFVVFAAGWQMCNTAVSAYVFDCYTEHIIEIMPFYTFFYNLSAFIEPWFINYWVESVGYTWCFATQALIALLLIPVFVALQRWGPLLAKKLELD